MLLVIFPRFLCHFLLDSFRGCVSRPGESLWVPYPEGSPVTAVARCPLQLALCAGWFLQSCALQSHHRDEHFPPCWSQESLVAVLGQVAGLAAQWHPWVGMELLCLVLAFRAWARSLFDRSCLLELQRNANCSEIAIAMLGCAHRKHPGPGRFVGSSKSCLALRVLVEWQL